MSEIYKSMEQFHREQIEQMKVEDETGPEVHLASWVEEFILELGRKVDGNLILVQTDIHAKSHWVELANAITYLGGALHRAHMCYGPGGEDASAN